MALAHEKLDRHPVVTDILLEVNSVTNLECHHFYLLMSSITYFHTVCILQLYNAPRSYESSVGGIVSIKFMVIFKDFFQTMDCRDHSKLMRTTQLVWGCYDVPTAA